MLDGVSGSISGLSCGIEELEGQKEWKGGRGLPEMRTREFCSIQQ